MKYLWIVLGVIFLLGSAPLAAQQTAPSPHQKPTIALPGDSAKKKSVQHYTRAQLEEAQAFYVECVASPSAAFFNCACAASTFLKKREITGPDADAYWSKTQSYYACPDPVQLAGTAYQSCQNWATTLHPNPEKFCECYARRYWRNFVTASKTGYADLDSVQIKTMDECDFAGPVARQGLEAWNEREMGLQRDMVRP